MKKTLRNIDYFIITTTMENGDKWETIRHTREGLTAVIDGLFEDHEVASFTVEEKVAA